MIKKITTMFDNAKIALRNLRRNPVFSIINITGLSVGITLSIMIFFWVFNERNFDSHVQDKDRIYRITYTSEAQNGGKWIWGTVSYPLVSAAKEIPGVELVGTMRSVSDIEAIKVNDEIFPIDKEARFVDKTWMELFDYKVTDGSINAFEKNPYSVILMESEAKKFFRDKRAVGQTIFIYDNPYTVQAVVKDIPANSTFFNQKILASVDAFLKDPKEFNSSKNWYYCNWITFVKLRPDADVHQVEQAITQLYPQDENSKITLSLRSLPEIHFETDIENTIFNHGNSKMVSIFIALGILLLFVACINYVNLTTSKASLRSKEVGVKKIIGARRMSLFMQFISESFIVSLLSILISLLLLWVLSPLYCSLVDHAVISFSTPEIWMLLGLVLLIITLMNGIYPAIILSSFKPINALRGMGLNLKDNGLRKGLVVFQFTISVALIISVLVIYKQMHFIQSINPGYEREQVISIKTPYNSLFSFGVDQAKLIMQRIKGELNSDPNIAGVTLCSEMITNIQSSVGVEGSTNWDGRIEGYTPQASVMSADEDYLNVLGLEMIEGRWFNANNLADKENVILNETAVRDLLIPEPVIGRKFDAMGAKGQIIGIVKDFHFMSLHEKIVPLIISNSRNYMLTIKTQPGKTVHAIQATEKIWNESFPNTPFEYTFLDDSFNNLYKSDIQSSRLVLIFCVLTVIIALLGLFGLSTFSTERRTKEIGIRKILGASVSGLVQMLSKEFLILVLIAFVIAVPISWFLMTKWLDNFAYKVEFTAWIFISGGFLTLIIALMAMGFQTIKAATANPVNSIKNE